MQFPDDIRLHERPRKRKLEPPSQIAMQSLMKSQNYAAEQILNFTKPLINYAIINQKEPIGRYNHNYSYLGNNKNNQETQQSLQTLQTQQENQTPKQFKEEFIKEPYNQSQNDYKQKYSLPQNNSNQRLDYSSVGNMLINQQPSTYSTMNSPKLQQAGSPNSYKQKIDQYSNSNPFNYYGSRALKNLDSTQIY